jgi:YVTN family beta-propeller protein
VALVLIVAGAAAGITAVVVTHHPKHTLAAIPPNSVAVIDPNGAMHDAIPVGQAPEAITYGAGSVWVTNSGDNTVMRINPKTHEVIQTITVGSNPVGIAVAGSHVWVTNTGDGTVTEIDSTTNRIVGDPIRVGGLPDAIAANDQGAWVANAGDGNIVHIDAHSGAAGKPVTVGEDPQGLALDSNTLWVSSAKDRIVSHIDAATGDEIDAPKDVGAGAKGIAVTPSAVWIANNAALTVTRIGRKDASSTTLSVGDGPDAVVAAQGRIWVSDQYEPTVAVIDATSARVLHLYATGSAVHGMTAVGSSLWVATQNSSGAGHRGGTLVVAEVGVPGDFGGHLDPPRSYITNEEAALRPVYDTLVAYRARPADSQVLPWCLTWRTQSRPQKMGAVHTRSFCGLASVIQLAPRC